MLYASKQKRTWHAKARVMIGTALSTAVLPTCGGPKRRSAVVHPPPPVPLLTPPPLIPLLPPPPRKLWWASSTRKMNGGRARLADVPDPPGALGIAAVTELDEYGTTDSTDADEM